MTDAAYQRFPDWAERQPNPPRPNDVRREFGVSNPTACRWLQRLRGRGRRGRQRDPGSHIETVFEHLARCAQPVTVGQVAEQVGLDTAAAMHALQNLYEAERVLRNTHIKPFTYHLPPTRALALMPATAVVGLSLVPSVGQVLAPALRAAA